MQDAEKAWKKIENGIGEKYRQYQDGEISQQDYYAWINGNKKIAKLRDEVAANIADRMTKSADIASAYINDTTPRVFKENANRAAYTIEKGMKGGVSFSLINDDSLRAIMTGNTTEFKARWKDTFTDPPKIYKWSYSKVQDSLYMGMVKGESIQKIAKRIQQVTGSDMSVAVRNARTSMTCAANQGQMATFERAASMGIEIKKEWVSTHDGRVRDSHASLDGVKVPYKEKFPNGLMCPADPSGAPAEVYNCRCTMARVPFDDEDTSKYTEKRYQEWKNEKENGKITTGARITDSESEDAEAFAKMYYSEIRSFSTDIKKIAENTGKSVEDIQKVKEYLFENNSLYDDKIGEYRRFDPDCAIAQSWQRLMQRKENIKPHDMTLIEHELYEMQIKKDNPYIEHLKAHEIASKKYNYGKESTEYYDNLKKHSKSK